MRVELALNFSQDAALRRDAPDDQQHDPQPAPLVFLGLSLACAATATVWHHYPDVVRRFDESIVNGHVESASDVLSEAEDLLHAGERDGAPPSSRTWRSLRDAKPGDRLFRPRKTAIEEAARLLIGSEETSWPSSGATNCTRSTRATCSTGCGGYDSCASAAARKRVERGSPRSPASRRATRRIQADLVPTLLDYGEAETVSASCRPDALSASGREPSPLGDLPALGRGPLGDAARARSGRATDGQGVRITCRLPEPLAPPQVRLDLPSGSTLLLEDVTLRARGTGGAETILAAPPTRRRTSCCGTNAAGAARTRPMPTSCSRPISRPAPRRRGAGLRPRHEDPAAGGVRRRAARGTGTRAETH